MFQLQVKKPHFIKLLIAILIVFGCQYFFARSDASGRWEKVRKQIIFTKSAVKDLQLLIVFLFLLLENLFIELLLVIQSNIKSLNSRCQIHFMSFLDTGAIDIIFVNVTIVCYICKVLQIFFILLAKLKSVRSFKS